MSRETQFLLCGMVAGLTLGIVISFAVQHRQRSMRPLVDAAAVNRRSAMLRDDGGTTMLPQERAGVDAVITQSDESVAMQISPLGRLTFSVPFVRALQELKAAGEPADVIVNLVTGEFNRQWREQMKEVNRKLRSGEIDREEEQEFLSGREGALGKTIAELLGQDSFVYWDKQRLLRKGGATGYKLTDTESNELYRVEKEHDGRRLELHAALSAGQIDPLDFEGQNKESEEQYQQLRAKFLTEDRRVQEQGATTDLRAEIKQQTRQLNLSPQEVDALAAVALKNLQASQEMGASDTNPASRMATEELAEAATEQEWKRILGPQRFAEFKRANDDRYQQMKRYQSVWQLSDADVNSLYEKFAKYEKAIVEHRIQAAPVPAQPEAEGEERATDIDNFVRGLNQQLETELRRFLGEDRFRRFMAAGLVPQNSSQDQ